MNETSPSLSRGFRKTRPDAPRSTPVTTAATSSATSSRLARPTTERDPPSLEAQVTSVERCLELVQVETTQLRTQLANWKIVKKEEDAEIEEERKRGDEQEQELEEARRRIIELEKRAGETEALETKVEEQTDATGLLMRR